jgi:hypothetical protein
MACPFGDGQDVNVAALVSDIVSSASVSRVLRPESFLAHAFAEREEEPVDRYRINRLTLNHPSAVPFTLRACAGAVHAHALGAPWRVN